MKKKKFYLQTIAIICLFVLSINCSAYASSQINVVSPEEAKELALFYYCSNQPTDDLISIDNYVTTPLYDDEGNVTYYAVDFFYEGEGKGYVLIGGNLTDLQCPELSLEGNSPYYLNALAGNETIYFNPLNIYSTPEDEPIFYDVANQEVPADEVMGEVFDGNLFENRALLNSVSDVEYAEDSRDSFQEHPTVYLANLGYTDIVSTSTYGTCETEMRQAGAFNAMFNVPVGGRYVGGILLKNPNHCAITVASNLLLYLRYKYSLYSLPSTYEAIFATALRIAVENYNYVNERYDENGKPYLFNFDNIGPLIILVLRNYHANLVGFILDHYIYDWDFLTTHINEKRPVIAGFWHDHPMENEQCFIYNAHFTTIFGYNKIQARKNGYSYEYKFIKLYDGWVPTNSNTPGRYVCWQALTSSELNLSIDENGNIIDHSIRMNMLVAALEPGVEL